MVHGVIIRLSQYKYLWCYDLKEYYEIVNEARPLSGFFPTDADFLLQKCIFNYETKQSSKFQSDPSSNGFTIDV